MDISDITINNYLRLGYYKVAIIVKLQRELKINFTELFHML